MSEDLRDQAHDVPPCEHHFVWHHAAAALITVPICSICGRIDGPALNEEVHAAITQARRQGYVAGTHLVERGRRLASERDDLIAAGVDPADLLVPAAPDVEFPPTLTVQGSAKPGEYEPDDEDAVRAVHDDCDPDWCASEGHQVCGYAVLIAALDAARVDADARWAERNGRILELADERDAARDLAAALEAELARVRAAVDVGATPALIAEILDEALDG